MSKYEWRPERQADPDIQPETFALDATMRVLCQRRLIMDLQSVGSINAEVDELESFPEFQLGAIGHILVGDSRNGAHHLRSSMDLEVEDRVYASKYGVEGLVPSKKRKRYVSTQQLRESGTFACRIVEIEGRAKERGSSMFPSEWQAMDVLQAISQVARTAESEPGRNLVTIEQNGIVDGIRIKVVSSVLGGIITAYPSDK